MRHVSYMLHHPAPHVPHTPDHTPSIASRHLPPNSARFSYATEGALFISAQLSTDAVSALRKVWVLIKLQALVYDTLLSRNWSCLAVLNTTWTTWFVAYSLMWAYCRLDYPQARRNIFSVHAVFATMSARITCLTMLLDCLETRQEPVFCLSSTGMTADISRHSRFSCFFAWTWCWTVGWAVEQSSWQARFHCLTQSTHSQALSLVH